MFNFDFRNNRMLLIILGVMIVSGIIGMSQDRILGLILSLPGLLIAITFHEFAHAWAADKLGDDTPRYQGRLTLNPLKHLDPFGSILLLFAGFGWGKPVQVNPSSFKGDMTKGEIFVSIAGPVMNFILAILLFVIYYTLIAFGVFSNMGYEASLYSQIIIHRAIAINIGLGIFNLIPLPPLDGSKIFRNILPYKARETFMRNEQILYLIFVVIFITGASSYIITPIITAVYDGMGYIIGSIFKLFV